MRYPTTLRANPWEDGIRDVWDGEVLRFWVEQGTVPRCMTNCKDTLMTHIRLHCTFPLMECKYIEMQRLKFGLSLL